MKRDKDKKNEDARNARVGAWPVMAPPSHPKAPTRTVSGSSRTAFAKRVKVAKAEIQRGEAVRFASVDDLMSYVEQMPE